MEQHLIQKARNGDPKSLEMLYKHFYGYAISIALRYSNSRDEACEIVNDSFMKMFDKLDQYKENNSFKGWFRRILVNTSIDYYRKNVKHFAVMDIDHAELESSNPEIIDQLSLEDILLALRSLPEILRIIFNMYEIEGFSHKEIGEKLGIPASSSRTYLARAKQNLREKIIALNHINNEGAVR
ncbi:RNA polymerase sigma factor, sigma-70 family [Belliella baltica DSM 15883]|uniref:RNA polymerase sigma factor, sigma-70 family n=1 Tax=Belliella baltica (strain DSM 15883 / CIP 108006 / LMG 21964 / BA134) TaxID=866536 RepID=I3Z4I6_BELBD|nr:RNA polymerase sigma factor [Belliella baltica]AFL84154.1 RNA polymerase sigma factor, sigma-70 family [Belliella baltica DSM 15883]